ncbi:MAG: chorismate mutase [Clostridia bacterium]|nr:chorismate mutase [Clostridia bacterium]
MDLMELREQINEIDREMLDLFLRRMQVSSNVAEYKRQNGLPVLDAARERELLANIAGQAGEDLDEYAIVLYSTILSLSRSYQHKKLSPDSKYGAIIENARETTAKLFPEKARVACQGVEGAYSQIAASKMFKIPSILYFSSFDGVFAAIESGMCEYGVLPIENSTAGSVKRVYDLMVDHNLYVVRSMRVKIDHNLLAKPGTKLSDIKEIFSHEQAIDQSAAFLRTFKDVKVTVCPNTAVAARMVAESERNDVAALSSRDCAELYGLESLANSVQDKSNNYTRFICVAKNPQIYPGADRTSIMLVTPHKPGALYNVLARINALGLNLLKLESRPLPEREFEFMFYFDIEGSAYSPELLELISELESDSEEFKYLGTYAESIG